MTHLGLNTWTDVLGWTLLHSLWQAAAVGALTWVALQCTRRASSPARYLVSCIGMVLLLICPLVTCVYLAAGSGNNTTNSVTKTSTLQASAARVERVASVAPVRKIPPTSLSANNSTYNFEYRAALPYVVAAWLAGIVTLSLRLFIGYMGVKRLTTRGTEPVPAKLAETFNKLYRRLSLTKPVRLLASSAAAVPITAGILKPIILLPVSALTGLTPRQLELVIAHELAHIRRHDYVVNLVQTLIETLLFYHPMAWYVSLCIRTEREHCCDDMAVALCDGDGLALAHALTKLAEARSRQYAFALSSQDGSLLTRIKRLVAAPGKQSTPGAAWAAVCVLGLSAVFAVSSILPARAQEQKAAKPIHIKWPTEDRNTTVAVMLLPGGKGATLFSLDPVTSTPRVTAISTTVPLSLRADAPEGVMLMGEELSPMLMAGIKELIPAQVPAPVAPLEAPPTVETPIIDPFVAVPGMGGTRALFKPRTRSHSVAEAAKATGMPPRATDLVTTQPSASMHNASVNDELTLDDLRIRVLEIKENNKTDDNDDSVELLIRTSKSNYVVVIDEFGSSFADDYEINVIEVRPDGSGKGNVRLELRENPPASSLKALSFATGSPAAARKGGVAQSIAPANPYSRGVPQPPGPAHPVVPGGYDATAPAVQPPALPNAPAPPTQLQPGDIPGQPSLPLMAPAITADPAMAPAATIEPPSAHAQMPPAKLPGSLEPPVQKSPFSEMGSQPFQITTEDDGELMYNFNSKNELQSITARKAELNMGGWTLEADEITMDPKTKRIKISARSTTGTAKLTRPAAMPLVNGAAGKSL